MNLHGQVHQLKIYNRNNFSDIKIFQTALSTTMPQYRLAWSLSESSITALYFFFPLSFLCVSVCVYKTYMSHVDPPSLVDIDHDVILKKLNSQLSPKRILFILSINDVKV